MSLTKREHIIKRFKRYTIRVFNTSLFSKIKYQGGPRDKDTDISAVLDQELLMPGGIGVKVFYSLHVRRVQKLT
jgi:hypothetical protein